MALSDFKTIFDFMASIATVFGLLLGFLNWFFDYKFDQKMSQYEAIRQKENRCSSSKGKQR